MKNTEVIMDLLIKAASEVSDPDELLDIIREGQKVMVSTFAIYMVLTAHDHKEHKDCRVNKSLRIMCELFKEQLMADIDRHVEMNLEVNGFSLDQTANEKVRDQILKDLAKENGT